METITSETSMPVLDRSNSGMKMCSVSLKPSVIDQATMAQSINADRQMNMLWNSQVDDVCVVFSSWHITGPITMALSW